MVASGVSLFRWRSYLPLLFLPLFLLSILHFTYPLGSETLDNLWDAFCLTIAMAGVTLRVLTVGFVPARTSGRNTKRQKADTLNTTGMYSVVRHPLYLGNGFIWMGLALFTHAWWLVVIAALAFWLYYERIILAEEDYLEEKFGDEFTAWAARTPTFIPDLRGWTAPALSFCVKAVLARENSTLSSTILAFFILEVSGDYFAGKMPHLDIGWEVLVVVEALVYSVLRWLKKNNHLAVSDR